ncbi:MAG: helix-turn-helix domain-containing protein [Nanoarchaeota archaeon]|nr:helix-turn-helix domain-containing protein [Nanoarchaeota archaeon]
MEDDIAKESLSKKIAGEIVLSEEPGKTIQKWRNIFKIPQRTLANELGMMPSVISDYENGRRQSPGIKIIRKIVTSMINLDEKAGGKVIREFSNMPSNNNVNDALIDSKEFSKGIIIKDFCKKIKAELVVRRDMENDKIYGYSIIDALKAIVELSPSEMVRLHGLTSKKALIFSGANTGRSSMIALKIGNVRPGLVVLQTKEKDIDVLARRIAHIEGIPVAVLDIKTSELKSAIKKVFK